jgi:hypothetical protein
MAWTRSVALKGVVTEKARLTTYMFVEAVMFRLSLIVLSVCNHFAMAAGSIPISAFSFFGCLLKHESGD